MKIGIVFGLLSAGLFGASTPFAKLLPGTIDPWMMAGLLHLGAGAGLAVIQLSRAHSDCQRRKRRCGAPTCHGSRW